MSDSEEKLQTAENATIKPQKGRVVFHTKEERLKWREENKGTYRVEGGTAENPLKLSILLTPEQAWALGQGQPEEKRKEILSKQTVLRKHLWDLIKENNLMEIGQLFGRPMTVEETESELRRTDIPRIARK